MNILLAGKVEILSNQFMRKLVNQNKCVAYLDEGENTHWSKKLTIYRKQNNFDNLDNIFQTHDFDYVIFFAQSVDGTVSIFDELEKLERFLYAAREHHVKHFLYVTSNDLQGELEDGVKDTSRYIMMQACERLCKSSAQTSDMHMSILRIPYLYSMESAENHLQRWITLIGRNKAVKINGNPEIETDFLCDEDLGELIARMVDEPSGHDYEEMNLSGHNQMTLKDFEGKLKSEHSSVAIAYGYQNLAMPKYYEDDTARIEYAWYPAHKLTDDLAVLGREIKQNSRKQEKEEQKLRLSKQEKRIRKVCRIGAELVILFAASFFLNQYLENNVLLNFVDFFIIYVVIMGTMNGQNAGIIAGILASIGYLSASLATTDWQILFYNVQNWLPFAIYILLGSVSGYTKDKHDDAVRFMQEEYDILEKKYIFLNELYLKVLESKNRFNSQIIGYKDSFGKLYGVVKKLDSTVMEEINFEAITTLEDMLENHTVALYSINAKGGFARLEVCSKSINEQMSKSVRLDDYQEMMPVLYENQLFVNTNCLENYPVYAAPIQSDGVLIAMIFIMKAAERQMNMEFSNKLMILSNLVGSSIIRAITYGNLEQDMVEGTKLLKPDKFRELLAIKKNMRDQEYLDYVLLCIHQDNESQESIAKKVSALIRNTDLLGLNEQGEIILLLNQSNDQSIEIVRKRLEEQKLAFHMLEE